MEFEFGEVAIKNNKTFIKPIANHKQSDTNKPAIHQNNIARLKCQWDNVKHTQETVTTVTGNRKKPRSAKPWGLCIKTSATPQTRVDDQLKFGIVVSMKELNGKNRYHDFLKMCHFNKWTFQKLNNLLDVYNAQHGEIDLE